MAKYTIDSSTLTDIADAIRTQYDDDSPINPLDMAEAILGIEGGGSGGEVPFNMASTTLTTEGGSISFEHDLGKTPTFYMIFATNPTLLVGKQNYKFLSITIGSGMIIATGNSAQIRNYSSTTAISLTADADTIDLTLTTQTYKIPSGIEFTCLYW